MSSRALHTLLHTIVDYAGLFPPAGLDMESSVSRYAQYHASPHSWMLGRFIVPAARLDEFAQALAPHTPPGQSAWRVSALVGDDTGHDLDAVHEFNEARHDAVVDALEVRASTPEEIHELSGRVPATFKTYVEIPVTSDPLPLVMELAGARLRAKIRTGGVVPGAIPGAAQVAQFLRACYTTGVAFKATAGLHHPLRREYALTYRADAPRAVMHGFLNVFLAAVFHYNGLTHHDTLDMLNATALDDVVMDDEKIVWREYAVSVAEVSTIRRRHAVAFGSCSFTEPVEDLTQLGLLP